MIVGDDLSCLIHYCNEKRTIRGFQFKNLFGDLAHLQYADDTLLFSSWENGNLETWWQVINLFLLSVELSLNRSNTSLISINLDSADLAPYARTSGCMMDNLPFNYLGFSIGGVVIGKRFGTLLKSDSDIKLVDGGMCLAPKVAD